MKSLIIARSQNKQTLKDAFRRLKRIRFTCGEKDDDDDDDNKTKDPLLICIANFERRIGDAEELLLLPPDQIFSEQDKLHLRRAVLGAQQELKTMESMLVSAEAKYNTRVLKQKHDEKLVALESERDRCKKAFAQAEETLNDLRKTQDERERAQMDLLTKGGKIKPKEIDLPISREPIQSIDGGAGQKRTMKKAMDILARTQGVMDDEDAAAAEGGMDTSAYQWDPSVTLQGDASTKQQAVKIQQQKREVQQSLARIHDGVTRLHEMSKMMAAEIEDQNRRIEKLDQVVEQRQQKLQDLNEKIEKLNESMKPMNCCFNVLCFLILLAIAGFLLYYYEVVTI